MIPPGDFGFWSEPGEQWLEATTSITRTRQRRRMKEARASAVDALYQRAVSERTTNMKTTGADYGDYLSKIPWNFYTTLTFRLPVGWETAVRRFNIWIRRLQQRAQGELGWFRSVERGRHDLVHLHSLIEEPESLLISDLQGAWKWGRTDIQIYDPTRGGAYYVAKDIASGKADWDIHRRKSILDSRSSVTGENAGSIGL